MHDKILFPTLRRLFDYAGGVFQARPCRAHPMPAIAVAIAFLVAPFVFGWRGPVLAYYLFKGVGVLTAVALSKTRRAAAAAAEAG